MVLKDEENNEQPWWVGAVYKIGIPSAIAIYLVWFLSVQVRDRIELMDQRLNTHITETTILLDHNRRTLRILHQICINSATTNEERVSCFQ